MNTTDQRAAQNARQGEQARGLKLGTALRAKIRAHKDDHGCTYRHLSKAIGREGNYIASYVGKDPSEWAIPKHPTFGKLLNKLGTTEAELLAENDSSAPQEVVVPP